MNTVKNMTIAFVILGTACIAYVNRERIKKILLGETEAPKRNRPRKGVNAMEEVRQAFLMFADNFQGLYEPMYKASIGTISFERKLNVLMEWDIRINSIGNLPVSLKGWWSTIVANLSSLSDDELQKRATTVIEMVKSCNIIRDQKTQLTVNEETMSYYQRSDGNNLVKGQKIHVETPCWYLDSTPVRILEKGYC